MNKKRTITYRQEVKRVLFMAISILFFLVDLFWRLVCIAVHKTIPATGVVLYYHSIPAQQRVAFARQMDKLIRWSRPLRADTRAPLSPGVRHAAVTFDDVYQNIIENALPELAQRHIPATLFVVADALGETPKWTSYSTSDLAMNEPILTEDQLQKISSDLVQIGSHTCTHPMLTRLREEDARYQLSGSRTKLEHTIGCEVKLFSFPYGAFNDNLIRWCREEGYERIFTTLPYQALSSPNEFVVGRVRVDPQDWSLEFMLKLFGAYKWLPYAFALKRYASSKLRARNSDLREDFAAIE